MPIKAFIFGLQLAFAVVAPIGLAQRQSPLPSPKPCSREEARKAEDDTDKLKTWSDVYSSFQRYGHCDDGAIAEGYSDKIVHLLATDWKHFPDLNRLARTNPQFKSFVLQHIDLTADSRELGLADHSARNRCPTGAEALCRAIVKQIAKLDSGG